MVFGVIYDFFVRWTIIPMNPVDQIYDKWLWSECVLLFTCLLPVVVLLVECVFAALLLLQADVDLLFSLLLQPPQLLLSLTPLLLTHTHTHWDQGRTCVCVCVSVRVWRHTSSSSSSLLCSSLAFSWSDNTTCSGSTCSPEKRFSSSASFLALDNYTRKTLKHAGHLHRLLLEVINY